jgi:hypothetical protein
MVVRTEGETIPITVIEFGPVTALRSQGAASCQAQPPPAAPLFDAPCFLRSTGPRRLSQVCFNSGECFSASRAFR